MEKIKKAVSIKIAKQIDGTCWAYASTTVILKLMKNIIPEDLEYIDENDTCDYQENIVDLNPDRCGLIDYNNIILFKYLYYILTNEFGCDGLIDDKVIESFNWIIRDLLNNKEPLIVNENYPKDRFNSTQYEDIIKLLNNFKLKPITYSLINIRDSLDNKFN